MIEQFLKDIDTGLSAAKKSLPSKYFYNKIGDALFTEIMNLPEYYVTRAELEIFKKQTKRIIKSLDLNPNSYFELLELGAGDGLKTKELLRVLDELNYNFEYSPIDISQNVLDKLEQSITNELSNVSINTKQGDYFQVLKSLKNGDHPKIVLFLGSNLGNMSDKMASQFIAALGDTLNPGDKVFLGVDLLKPTSIVLPAYNDSKGITAAFNFNLLQRINDELGGNFNINNFKHEPEYCEKEGLAKSFLISKINQDVVIEKLGKSYTFLKNEKILTEISRKYNDHIINKILENTDLKIIAKLSDSKAYFTDYVLERKGVAISKITNQIKLNKTKILKEVEY